MASPESTSAAGADPLASEPALRGALDQLAKVHRLLVTSDYDGVLAPIVTDPARAFPLPAGIDALRSLAGLPSTTVALLSGRARADLAKLAELGPPVRLVGGHGAELTERLQLTDEQAALRERLATALAELVADYPGAWLEAKPASLVVHTRTAAPEVGAAARAAVHAGPGSWPGVALGTGKEVVELSVVSANKGTALAALRTETGADAVLFLGDDVTDENAFAVLGDADVGVKVGPGETRAGHRVADPPAAVAVLEFLREQRSGAVAGRS
ncbi:trehalose-phosphatase [Natronosporangium hydrolyticum]|uniref:Trehalose 6-phosphate phosphatase n=1 Tax=Natronosporangium hydrolyticum TaxID=2811111 RepID=A0A895YE50_9ACTN|nr:trehalose-phosphatase [Natronosporangium hydrolyticum]QSB13679.1 trehalose-phosphatase [Natronosporangium hydrolyticum]